MHTALFIIVHCLVADLSHEFHRFSSTCVVFSSFVDFLKFSLLFVICRVFFVTPRTESLLCPGRSAVVNEGPPAAPGNPGDHIHRLGDHMKSCPSNSFGSRSGRGKLGPRPAQSTQHGQSSSPVGTDTPRTCRGIGRSVV